jgi:quercetin dioxygenase-like cupin family protein
MAQEHATPFSLADSVQYQDGSIVSKTILNKPTGSMTLFAFDQGQALSEHSAPFDAVIQMVAGEAEVMLSGHAHHLTAGQALVMSANAPHAVKALTPCTMLLTMMKS